MKLIKRLFLVMLAIVSLGSVVAVFMMIDSEPQAGFATTPTTDELRRARVFIENVDPRSLEAGALQAFTISEGDLELLLSYGLSQLHGGGAAIELDKGLATALLSIRLPENWLGDYVNISLQLSQISRGVGVESLTIGSLRFPAVVADSVLNFAHKQLQAIPEYVSALNAVNGFSFSPGQINVVYQWQPELARQIRDRGRDLLLSQEDQLRLLSHASNLASLTRDGRLGREVSLAELMGPMLLFAKVRGGDAVEENRAAIISMAMFIGGIDMARTLGMPDGSLPPAGKVKLTLSNRHDFAQHFLISAGLAVSSGSNIADAIGLLKELEDSEGGSGFSFTDLGADRTGVRFAEIATNSTENARALQDKFAYGVTEAYFFAEFRDLPEFMDGDTFRDIYGGVGSSAYDEVLQDIENRISRTPLFTEF